MSHLYWCGLIVVHPPKTMVQSNVFRPITMRLAADIRGPLIKIPNGLVYSHWPYFHSHVRMIHFQHIFLCVDPTEQLRYCLKWSHHTKYVWFGLSEGWIGWGEAHTSSSQWGSQEVKVFLPSPRRRQRPSVRNLVVHHNVCAPEPAGALCKSMRQHECGTLKMCSVRQWRWT